MEIKFIQQGVLIPGYGKMGTTTVLSISLFCFKEGLHQCNCMFKDCHKK